MLDHNVDAVVRWAWRLRRGVAQPGSAPEWGSGGRRFKSCLPDSDLAGRRLSLPTPAHVPFLDRAAPAVVVEPDQKEVVVLADELGFGSVLEVAAPSIRHRE